MPEEYRFATQGTLWNLVLTVIAASVIGAGASIVSGRMSGAVQAEQIQTLRRDVDEMKIFRRELEREVSEHKQLQIHPGADYRMMELEHRISRMEQRKR